MAIGCTIAYLHDIADITASFTKFFSCTDYTHFTVFFFFCNLVVWGYTRLYLLPNYMYFVMTELMGAFPGEYAQFGMVTSGAVCMLGGLLVLHFYWYCLFLKILFLYKTKGSTEDI